MILKKLSDLKTGENAMIDSFLKEDIAKKFLSLGIIPNQKISVQQIAPMGNLIAINIDGDVLALRKEIASQVFVSQ